MDYKETLAKNAHCGDGSYWRHPECVNYKLVFTGINKDWLDYKGSLVGREAVLRRKANAANAYANSKPLWSVTTLVDPVFTAYSAIPRADLLQALSFDDFVLWFLDDGTTCIRKGKAVKKLDYKYLLCIGDFISGLSGGEESFLSHVSDIFNTDTRGSICKNNSKASQHNLVWNIPVKIGRKLVEAGRYLDVPGFENKLRTIKDQTSEIIPKGSRPPGLRLPKRGSL